jgi:GH24 family phage-related lysozyme (muramidase)
VIYENSNIFFFNLFKSNAGKDLNLKAKTNVTTQQSRFDELLYRFLVEEEGVRYKTYICPTGYLSIGIGHNIDANGLPPDILATFRDTGKITDDQVEELFELSKQESIKVCHRVYGKEFFESLSDIRKICLISMAFQMGEGWEPTPKRKGRGLKSFVKTNQDIKNQNWRQAGIRLRSSLWASKSQTPRRALRTILMLEQDKFITLADSELIYKGRL